MLWKKYVMAIAGASSGSNGGGPQNGSSGLTPQDPFFDPALTGSVVPPNSFGIAFSNSNRTVAWSGVPPGFTNDYAWSNINLSAGKHYGELHLDNANVANSYWAGLGNTTHTFEIAQEGNGTTGRTGFVSGAGFPGAFTVGDVINVAVDFDAGKAWLGKNNVYPGGGDPATGTGASFTFPVNTPLRLEAILNSNGAVSPRPTFTGNFLDAQYAYTKPVGFSEWVSSGPVTSGPSAFTFTDQTAVEHSTVCTSAIIYITGITGTLSATVTAGGTISVNGGAFTAGPTNITNGQSLQVRLTSSASDSTAVSKTVTINGVSDIFTATTGDSVPVVFSFVDQSNVAASSLITSAEVTISGLTISSAITVSGDTGAAYSINGAAFTSSAGVVYNGDQVRTQVISNAAALGTKASIVAIGGVSDTFTVTTTSGTPSTTPVTWESARYIHSSVTNLAVADYYNIDSAGLNATGLTPINAIGVVELLASSGRSSGKYYFEVGLSGTLNDIEIGVAGATETIAYFTGDGNINFQAYRVANSSGANYFHPTGSSANYDAALTMGDIVMIAVDLTNGKLWAGKNGIWFFNADPVAATFPYLIAVTTYKPCIGSYPNGAIVMGKFTANALTYTPPTGFSAWYP